MPITLNADKEQRLIILSDIWEEDSIYIKNSKGYI